jgi:hypothetical protein
VSIDWFGLHRPAKKKMVWSLFLGIVMSALTKLQWHCVIFLVLAADAIAYWSKGKDLLYKYPSVLDPVL